MHFKCTQQSWHKPTQAHTYKHPATTKKTNTTRRKIVNQLKTGCSVSRTAKVEIFMVKTKDLRYEHPVFSFHLFVAGCNQTFESSTGVLFIYFFALFLLVDFFSFHHGGIALYNVQLTFMEMQKEFLLLFLLLFNTLIELSQVFFFSFAMKKYFVY